MEHPCSSDSEHVVLSLSVKTPGSLVRAAAQRLRRILLWFVLVLAGAQGPVFEECSNSAPEVNVSVQVEGDQNTIGSIPISVFVLRE